jgi:hypothetical protein
MPLTNRRYGALIYDYLPMRTIFALLICFPLLIHASETNRWFEKEVEFTPSLIAYGNGTWWGFANARYTSDDGLTWIKRLDNNYSIKPEFLRGEFYFLDSPLYASSNGWSNFRTVGTPFGGGPVQGFVFGNDHFYAVRFNRLGISTNGAQWRYLDLPELDGDLKLIAASNGTLVITTTAGSIYTLADDETWYENHARVSLSVLKGTSAGFLTVQIVTSATGNSMSAVLFSADGLDWNVVQEKPGYIDRIVVGDTNVALWGQNILAIVDPNGSNWREVTRPSNKLIADLAYGDGRFLGVLRYGGIISSKPFNQLRILSLSRSGSKIVLETDTREGYFVERTSSLGLPWTAVTNAIFRSGGAEVEAGVDGNAFFRLRTSESVP